MKHLTMLLVAMALVVAACSSSSDAGVATLEGGSDSADTPTGQAEEVGSNDEEAVLAFSQCMRDEGLEGFEDPDIGADGSIDFNLRGMSESLDADRETMRAAFESCSSHLEGLAFGPGSIDRSDVEDTLYEFAVCMRENGYDMPDPDLSFTPGGGGEGQGPFGDGLDPEDPAFQTALEECQSIFADLGRIPGSGGRRG